MKYFNYLRTFLPSNVSLHAAGTLDTQPEGRKDQKSMDRYHPAAIATARLVTAILLTLAAIGIATVIAAHA